MPISYERDMDCRLFIISSDDGQPVAWSKPIHFSDSENEKQTAALTEIAIPNRVFIALFGALPHKNFHYAERPERGRP